VAVIEALIKAGAEVGPKILAGLQWQQDRLDPSIVAGIEAVLRPPWDRALEILANLLTWDFFCTFFLIF